MTMTPPSPNGAVASATISNGSPSAGVASATLEAIAKAAPDLSAAATKAPVAISAAKAAPEVKNYELESAATALPDGGDALIKHRFRRACELVDVVAGEDCTILYARFGSRSGRELAEGESLAAVLAAEPYAPASGEYMILKVRNDDARVANVTAIVRVRGEHGPESIETSPFAPPGSASSGSAAPSRSSSMTAPSRGGSATGANANLSQTRGVDPNPKPRQKQIPSPTAAPKASSKRRVPYESRKVHAPSGMTLVSITLAQAESLVDALESAVPIRAFMRSSLAVALYEDSDVQSVFPGDVAVALSPADLDSLRDAAGGEHLTDLPDVLRALQSALSPNFGAASAAISPNLAAASAAESQVGAASAAQLDVTITTTTTTNQEQPAADNAPKQQESDVSASRPRDETTPS